MSKIQVQQVSTPGPLPPGGIVAVAAEDVRPSSEAWASQTTPTAAATPDQSVSMVEIVTPPQSSVGSSSVDYDLKQMAQPQSKQLSRVGLAVDSASRRLSLTRDCLPPGIYRWQVQENEQAWTWFTDIDEDRSGFLDKSEVKNLAKKLGVKFTDSMWCELDQDGVDSKDGKVTFPEFVAWFNDRKALERREQRLAVKELFEKMDRSQNGLLDKQEIKGLVKKARRKLNLVDPPFDIDADFKLMNKTASGEVTFMAFEKWWKDRTGIADVSIPVLPEIMVEQVNDAGKLYDRGTSKLDISQTRQRNGKGLWKWLRPRLSLIRKMQTQWGSIHEIYPSGSDSMYADIPLPSRVRDPDSVFSTCWDLTGVVLLLYVAIIVPLRSCFDVEVETLTPGWFFDVFVDIYFLADLVLNFFTAFYDDKGVREFRLGKIAANYLRGWFLIDLLSCLPVNYIILLVKHLNKAGAEAKIDMLAGSRGITEEEDNEDSFDFKAFKVIRLLRLSKMLRLAKVMKLLEKYAENMSNYIGIYAMFFAILLVAHLLGCFWYLVGTDSQTIPGVDGHPDLLVDGWTMQQEWEGRTPTLSTKYATSMAWAFNAIDNANTDAEKMFSVLAQVVVGFIFGAMAGVMSQLLASLKGNDQEYTLRLMGIRAWMKEQGVPKPEQRQVIDYFKAWWRNKTMISGDEILQELPPTLARNVSRQLYYNVLSQVPIFGGLPEDVLNALCSVARAALAVQQQDIFEEDAPGHEMYVLIKGEVEVLQGGKRLGFLSAGAFFGELPVLGGIVGSGLRTRTVRAVTECRLCYITRDQIDTLAEKHPELQVTLNRFRRLGEKASPVRLEMFGMTEEQAIKYKLMEKRRRARNKLRAAVALGSKPSPFSIHEDDGDGRRSSSAASLADLPALNLMNQTDDSADDGALSVRSTGRNGAATAAPSIHTKVYAPSESPGTNKTVAMEVAALRRLLESNAAASEASEMRAVERVNAVEAKLDLLLSKINALTAGEPKATTGQTHGSTSRSFAQDIAAHCEP